MTKNFKIQNRYILGLGNWLGSLPLPGPQSRSRTRFIDMLAKALKKFEKDRSALLIEIATKDADGNPVIKESENGSKNYDIPDDKMTELNVKMAKLQEKEVALDGPDMLLTITTVRDIVLNYDGKIEGNQAGEYENWCKVFEDAE